MATKKKPSNSKASNVAEKVEPVVAEKPKKRASTKAEAAASPAKATTTKATEKKPEKKPEIAPSPVVLDNALVAKRAWEIWQREGCPEGRSVEHWVLAEEELRSALRK